jgi:glycosyltransferase involved in cell wall biosynthesis
MMDAHRPLFTIFTPTYNRAGTLHRVYDSLRAQTFRDFEWVVVDDGSSDGTQALVQGWQREAGFPIRYEHQRNAGKHMAFNRGVALARGELFLSIDSDDACKPWALERLRHHWLSIPPAERERFSAVTALAEDQHGRENGTRFVKDVLDSDPRELMYRYRPTGDKWGFHRTEVLRRFPFPQVEGLRYVPESIVWCAIGKRYKTRYVNEVLLINYRDEGNDNLSRTPPAAGARGYVLRDATALSNDLDLFFLDPRAFLRRAANVSRFALHAGMGLRVARELKTWPARLLAVAMLPLGLALYLKDKRHAP